MGNQQNFFLHTNYKIYMENNIVTTPTNYRLAIDGDDLEKHFWSLFIQNKFPSYETFWIKFVVPLTNRPSNINFKSDKELKGSETKLDICIAQLNYSILRHLMRTLELLKALENSVEIDQQLNLLQEGIIRLVGAQDNAFELLEKKKNHSKYEAFKDSSKAREKWKRDTNSPLQHIRKYRNSLIHGRLLPGIMDGKRLCMPEIGKQDKYLDWRLVTELTLEREEYKKDFISVLTILKNAWDETIDYLEKNWQNL